MGIVLAVLALAGGGALSVLYRRPPPPVEQTVPGTTKPLVSIRRPVLKHTEEGQLAWQIRLKEIQVKHGAGQLSAEGIQEALIYGSGGEPLVRVTAQRVTGSTAGRDFEVTGQVTVVSYQGVVINTNKVHWSQAQGKIFCPGEVTARTREAMFSTREATYNINQNLIQAPNQVNLYSGQNKIIGKSLSYNLDTDNFALDAVQMIFNAEEARELLQEAQTG